MTYRYGYQITALSRFSAAIAFALALSLGLLACEGEEPPAPEEPAEAQPQPEPEPDPVFDRAASLETAARLLAALQDPEQDARALASSLGLEPPAAQPAEPDWQPPQPRQNAAVAALLDEADWQVDPRFVDLRDGVISAEDAATRSATGDRPLTYRVRPGDSLSVIAARTMGSGSRWRRLYEFNRDTIGPSPERLREGMELRIPQD